MEHLKKIYDEISTYNPFNFGTLDLSSFIDCVLQKIENIAMELQIGEKTSIKEEDLLWNGNENIKFKKDDTCLTREEKYIVNAKKLKTYGLDTGEIIACNDYIYGYQDLSFEQFCSYLYWRRQIREKCVCETPIAYLHLYLIEICNFVEFDTVEDAKDMLWFLANNLTEDKVKKVVYNAFWDFSILYGTVDDLKEIDSYRNTFQVLKEDVQYLTGEYQQPFEYIIKKSSYKVKDSMVYKENPNYFEKQFLEFFMEIVDLINGYGVNIIPLWIGRQGLIKTRFSYVIKVIEYNRIVEKIFTDNNVILLKVGKDDVYEAVMEPFDKNSDPENSVFHNKYIIEYPLRAFENELRKKSGKRQLKVCTKEMKDRLENRKGKLISKVIEIYNSEDFKKCIERYT